MPRQDQTALWPVAAREHYSLHDVVDVEVDPRVSPEIRRGIEFQIGHFRSERPGGAPAKIRIHPYTGHHPSPGPTAIRFHTGIAQAGDWWNDPEERVAVRRSRDGFDIYADTGSFLLNLYINQLSVQAGVCLVHAGGVVDPKGNAVVFPGPGGVGKTALVTSLVADQGYRLLGDDIVCLSSDGQALSFPRSFVLKEFHREQFPKHFAKADRAQPAWRTDVKRFLHENAPFKGVIKSILQREGRLEAWHERFDVAGLHQGFVAAVPVASLFGRASVATTAPLRRLVFLERHAGSGFRLRAMPRDQLASRLFSIIHHEWGHHLKQLLALASTDVIDAAGYFSDARRLLATIVEKAPACELLQVPDGTSAKDLTRHAIKELGL